MEITRVGFGGWSIDGSGWSFGWGPDGDGDSIAPVRRALDRRVGWIDTSLSSNGGPYVFAKCGLIFEEGQSAGEPRQSRWPASIRRECEGSLRRLGIERIDLYNLRGADLSGTRVQDSPRLAAPTFAAHRIGLVWYSPSQLDILTADLSRATIPASAIVVAWTLTSPGVAGAIVGAGSADQIESWIDAATLVLSRANLGEIATAIGRTGSRRGSQTPTVLAA